MPAISSHTVWTGWTSGISGAHPVGYCAIPDAAGQYIVIATSAARAAASRTTCVAGIAITAGDDENRAVEIQTVGPCPQSITGLGAGTASALVVDNSGRVARKTTPIAGDIVVGRCDADGFAYLNFPSSLLSAGQIAGLAVLNQRGTFAARPVASTTGRIYFCSDSPLVFFDDGAAWWPHGLTQAFNPPPAAAGLIITATGSNYTIQDDRGTLMFDATYRGFASTHDIIMATSAVGGKNAPYTLTVGFELHADTNEVVGYGGGFGGGAWSLAGVCRRVGTKHESLKFYANAGSWGLYMSSAQTLTANPSTNFTTPVDALRDRVVWLRIADSGATSPTAAVTYSWSVDGRHFYKAWSSHRNEAAPAFPDDNSFYAGIVLNPFNTSVRMRVFDWV